MNTNAKELRMLTVRLIDGTDTRPPRIRIIDRRYQKFGSSPVGHYSIVFDRDGGSWGLMQEAIRILEQHKVIVTGYCHSNKTVIVEWDMANGEYLGNIRNLKEAAKKERCEQTSMWEMTSSSDLACYSLEVK